MYLYDILTMKSIIFRKNGEVLSGIKVGVIFLCVYFFSNRGGGAIIGDRAIIRSFTVYIFVYVFVCLYKLCLRFYTISDLDLLKYRLIPMVLKVKNVFDARSV